MHPVDYSKVARAVELYHAFGYRNIEVPWIVDNPILAITQPRDTTQLQVESVHYGRDEIGGWTNSASIGGLIASAEQGFLQIRDKLNGRYVSSSPCFRSEEVEVPGMYQRQFFKVELMHANPVNPGFALAEIISYATLVMSTWTRDLQEVKTPEGWDLFIGDIEVGSYGIREFKDFKWVYGTGLALPRFDYAIRRMK